MSFALDRADLESDAVSAINQLIDTDQLGYPCVIDEPYESSHIETFPLIKNL
jgi:hypothetical protein